jgi:hypothetical protein
VPALVWLVVAVGAAVAGYLIAWPAWRAYRSRETRDTNTERYLAWRGRSPSRSSVREGMTGEERRRVYGGAALGVLAVAALLAFFATS